MPTSASPNSPQPPASDSTGRCPRVAIIGTSITRSMALARVMMGMVETCDPGASDNAVAELTVPRSFDCNVLVQAPNEPLCYGPQRKGRGGKLRRW